jgi:hypothetical protein
MINLLQKCPQIGEAFVPEHAVDSEPIDQRRETIRLWMVVDVAALASLRDKSALP